MFNDILLTDNINFILVFLGGIFSFFSPCIIPLLPVYMSYLSGNTAVTDENGNLSYNQKKVFIHTIFFILGISAAFFILGLSFSKLGGFFNSNRVLFTRISGVLILFLGLFQIGLLKNNFMEREHRIGFDSKEINPLIAFIIGFTFSFAWTPCIGPVLSTVLIMASGAKTAFMGNMLILVYTLGFVIPFLLLGVFTTKILNFLKAKKSFLKYSIKISGAILIIIGIMTLSGFNLNILAAGQQPQNANADYIAKAEEPAKEAKEEKLPAYDFELKDQYGNTHKLSDYKGKVVFLNFWATWCPPCREEMPHIEEIYKEYGYNKNDVVILGAASPATAENPSPQDESEEKIKAFLTKNNYTFPVVFDVKGEIFRNYYINAFPTTFMIDREGNIMGYVAGGLSKENMKKIIEMTLNNEK
ncbi:redoxin domain-containing protein [Fusobacterium ulcerans]|uniref:redoxin domain-containing protein n=1 Tax=Fusobacterium ulcerans TaxID=861 RepID=UPI001D0AA33B|nr:cytochrome c biogenesis protein CcdA [Fusobacterium ulcerans]MCB8566051.1 redoxin domain-containing protein [Fusobacterium ulcerans]MCB8650058.1 redoxin domain-containing protein [Fusobacterium ulcerans]